jgi:hypothetical protein
MAVRQAVYSRRMITTVVNDELLRLTFAMIVIYRKTSYMIDGNGCSIHLSFSVVNEWYTTVYDRACLTWGVEFHVQSSLLPTKKQTLAIHLGISFYSLHLLLI